MASHQLESSSSESKPDLHDVEDRIKEILPNIKHRRLTSFLEHLKKMGVETVNDLVYINDKDVSHTLTPIEARKLLDRLNYIGEFNINTWFLNHSASVRTSEQLAQVKFYLTCLIVPCEDMHHTCHIWHQSTMCDYIVNVPVHSWAGSHPS